jgi:SAM-dependent methyltransferase
MSVHPNSFARTPIVPVHRFNTVLDDMARRHYRPVIDMMFAVVPDMMRRKIFTANVQQAFVLAATLQLTPSPERAKVLCVGSYEDTACETLLAMGYDVEGIDPNVNGQDLSAFLRAHPSAPGTYTTIFSTSVIEHVPDDEGFARDIASLLAPGGVAVLTCDYRDAWQPGEPLPPTDERFYRSIDLRSRLPAAMTGCTFIDDPEWERFAPDFNYGTCSYSFASLCLRKSAP